jgi:hypothetical protein
MYTGTFNNSKPIANVFDLPMGRQAMDIAGFFMGY